MGQKANKAGPQGRSSILVVAAAHYAVSVANVVDHSEELTICPLLRIYSINKISYSMKILNAYYVVV